MSETASTINSVNLDIELADPPQVYEKKQLYVGPNSNLKPRHFGNNCVFLFKNNEPLITIGPHCN